MRSRLFLIAVCASVLFTANLFVIAPVGIGQGLVSRDLSRFRSVGGVALSPDGHRVAYSVAMRDRPGRPYGQLWIMDLATQKPSRIGGEKDSGGGPLWSPDGKSLAFFGHQGDKGGLLMARADGALFGSAREHRDRVAELTGLSRSAAAV